MTFLLPQSKLCHCSWVEIIYFFMVNYIWRQTFPTYRTILLISAVALIFAFVILVENVHVVIVYDCLDVLHAAVTHFNFISVEYLIKDVGFWEMGI